MPATLTPQSALQARRLSLDGETIIELQGNLDSSLTEELREEAISLVRPGCRLVLDLSELKEVSPTGVRMLLLFFRRVRAAGGTISVTGASPQLFDVAEAAGYLDLFRKNAPEAPVPTRGAGGANRRLPNAHHSGLRRAARLSSSVWGHARGRRR